MTAAFDLGAMLSIPEQLRNEVKQIPCDMLIPYHNHKFTLYEGERLDDMVESIRTTGVLIPIIVQPVSGGKYEILIGHNRWNAGRFAGLTAIPAIIKEGLTEEETEMYVIESNLLQRSFSEMKISEQAAVIAMRHSKMFSQGKRNDIIRELEMLGGGTLSQIETKSESGDSKTAIGGEYGISRASVARLIRISKLISALQELVDSGEIALNAAVELSYLSEETQELVSKQAADFKIDMKKSKQLRQAADSEGNVDTAAAVRIISGTADVKPKVNVFKINRSRIEHFFEADTPQEEIENIIERALTAYFGEQAQF
jgi:ParB family chromosome partitioning protein